MKKKLSVLVLCSVIAGIGLGFKEVNTADTPKPVTQKEESKPAEPTPLSFLSDEDLMKESS